MKRTEYRSLSEQELCRLIKKRGPDSDAAFVEVYNRFAAQVNAYCFRILNDAAQAEDTFQETFIRLYHAIRSEREITNLKGFLITIARNLCLNAKRDRQESFSLEEHLLASEDIGHERNELLALIRTALELLEPEFREAFVLKEYDGFSLAEVAEITGETLANTKSRIHRAKQQIRSLLADYIRDIQA